MMQFCKAHLDTPVTLPDGCPACRLALFNELVEALEDGLQRIPNGMGFRSTRQHIEQVLAKAKEVKA